MPIVLLKVNFLNKYDTMAAVPQTLCKEERLHGKRAISELFDKGNSFFQSPYKVFWINVPASEPYRSCFAVSVPKRRFKHAVDRNLMKRRTREVFRTNKYILNDSVAEGQQIRMMLVYSDNRLLPIPDLKKAMIKLLEQIARKHAESD